MGTEIRLHPDVQENRIALLNDLLECLKREREILTDLDVQDLWTVVEEKQGILQALEALPSRGPGMRSHGESGEAEPNVVEDPASTRTIDRLKGEIRERARENAEFIQDSLQFVDELVGLIAGVPMDNGVYGPNGGEHRAQRCRLFGREV